MDWQPIETAPRDGSLIMVANPNSGVWMAWYKAVYQSGFCPNNPWQSAMLNHDHLSKNGSWIPTHWMPLPDPPKG